MECALAEPNSNFDFRYLRGVNVEKYEGLTRMNTDGIPN